MLALCAVTVCVAPLAAAEAQAGDTSLVGLWAAKKRFGPDLRGQLVIDRRGGGGEWHAAIAGRPSTIVRAAGDSMSFALPGGSFTGRLDARRRAIAGQWIQPATVTSGSRFATPIVLTACGRDCFAGTVVPVDDEFTFYLRVTARPDGRLAAFLRNPERNLGRFIRADRIERSGERRTRTRRHGRGTAARCDAGRRHDPLLRRSRRLVRLPARPSRQLQRFLCARPA